MQVVAKVLSWALDKIHTRRSIMPLDVQHGLSTTSTLPERTILFHVKMVFKNPSP